MASRPAIRRLPRAISAVAVLTGLVTGSFAKSAAADPLDPAPGADLAESSEAASGPREDELPPPAARRNLIIAGGVTTAGFYGLALGSSLIWPDAPGAKDLRIPVAGPWMALGDSGCGNEANCSTVIVVLRAIATVVDGIGQAGGLAIAAEGLFLPTREPKRTRGNATMPAQSPLVTWRPTFDAGKNTVGVGVLGVF